MKPDLEPVILALTNARDWLENHGAAYCSDCGGVEEPGLAEVLGQIDRALAIINRENSNNKHRG